MAQVVTNLASTMCSFGLAPGTLMVLPAKRIMAGGQPVANIADTIPFTNVLPFGMCTSLANPAVSAATAAALGALTPMPCTPVIPAPWTPGSPTVIAGGMPALTSMSMCNCAYGGLIRITAPGQFQVNAK